VNQVTLGTIGSGRPYSLAAMGTASNVVMPFVDRSYTIGTIPALLQNKIILRTSEDDKEFAGGSLITFTLTVAADVYVFIDNRKTSNPTWLDGTWTADAPRNVIVSPGQTMLAFKKNFAAGAVTLGGNLQGGVNGALRNYFAIVDLVAGTNYEEGPISKNEFVHDKDQDGDGLHDEYEAVSTLNPWVVNTGGAGTIPDEDKISTGTTTRFQDQIVVEYVPPPVGGGGGGGGCGLGGLEFLIPLMAIRLFRARRRS